MRLKNYVLLLSVILFASNIFSEVNLNLASEMNVSTCLTNTKISMRNNLIAYQTSHGLTIINENFEELQHLPLPRNCNEFELGETKLAVINNHFHDFCFEIDIYSYSENEIIFIESIPVNRSFDTLQYVSGNFIINCYNYELAYYENYLVSEDTLELVSLPALNNYWLLYPTNLENKCLFYDLNNSQTVFTELNSLGELNEIHRFDEFYAEIVVDDSTIALRYQETIDFYSIDNNYSLTQTYTNNNHRSYYSGLYYKDGKLGYNIYNNGDSSFILLDTVNNFDVINQVSYQELTGLDDISFVAFSHIIQTGNEVYVALGNKPLLKISVIDDEIELVNLIEGFKDPTLWSNISNNYIYNNSYFDVYVSDITNINNPINLSNNIPKGVYQWYDIDDSLVACRFLPDSNYLNLYEVNSNNATLIDSVLDNSIVGNGYKVSLDFDGENLVYYTNSAIKSYNIVQDSLQWSFSYATDFMHILVSYQNYIYLARPSNPNIQVYQFDDEGINFIGSKYVGAFSVLSMKVDDGFLSVSDLDNGYCYDVRDNPIPQNFINELGISNIVSNVSIIDSLLCFVGNTDYTEDNDNLNNLCFYYESNNQFSHVGSYQIENDYIYNQVKMLQQEDGSFNVVLVGNVGTAIYSCHATPNGEFEIEPVQLTSSNYPNPFNPETTIDYDLSKAGKVEVSVYNLKGQKVKNLVKEYQEAGNHQIIWKGEDKKGKRVASGTYLYKVKSGGKEIINKMMMVK